MNLREAYTYFIVPFSFKERGVLILNKNNKEKLLKKELFDPSPKSIWEKACMHNLEENILYPYIQSFMQDMTNEEVRKESLRQESAKKNSSQDIAKISKLSTPIEQKDHYYQIYSIKESAKGKSKTEDVIDSALKSKLEYWKKFRKTDNYVIDKDREKNIFFNWPKVEQDFYSPKLILSPLAQVGFLMFCIKLDTRNSQLEDLTTLNYLLHKTGKGQAVNCKINLVPFTEEIAESQQKFESEINPHKKEGLEKELQKKINILTGVSHLLSPAQDGTWTMNNLLHFLFDELVDKNEEAKDSIVRFNNTRIHLFTYYQLENIDMDDVTSMNQVQLDLARIVRCQNQKYKLDIEDIKSSNLCMKTFQNIHIGSSVEGSAIMTILPNDAETFFLKFHDSSLSKRYIWIYIMVLIQRYTLLHLIHGLTQVDDDNLNLSLAKLKGKVEHLSAVKVNTYFTDVSDFTQHNQFYQFCIKNLCIKEHFQEIDEKMTILNAVIKHREEEKNEARSNKFALILAILTIASASKDGSDLLLGNPNAINPIWGILIIISLSAIVYIIWTKKSFYFIDKIKKYFNL